MHSDISKTLVPGADTTDPNSTAATSRPDPEVTLSRARRRLTTTQKLAILNEADRCTKPGELGALLRREGLYSSSLTNFRKQRDAVRLSVDSAQLRKQRLGHESARQRDARKIAHLEAEILKRDVLLELQKKVSELLLLAQQSQADY